MARRSWSSTRFAPGWSSRPEPLHDFAVDARLAEFGERRFPCAVVVAATGDNQRALARQLLESPRQLRIAVRVVALHRPQPSVDHGVETLRKLLHTYAGIGVLSEDGMRQAGHTTRLADNGDCRGRVG